MITPLKERLSLLLAEDFESNNFQQAFHQLSVEGLLDFKTLTAIVAEILNYLDEQEVKTS
jgi:hypothetical protein